MGYLILLAVCVLSVTAEFTDEMQVYDHRCLGENKFQCISGGCIDMDQYCDKRIDCPDASDENFCASSQPDAEVCRRTGQFLCLDGKKCIPSLWKCNSIKDCDDESDENMCPSKCRGGFECDKDKCLSMMRVCDSVYDCDDRTDEKPDSCRLPELARVDVNSAFCHEAQFSAWSQFHTCLDESDCGIGIQLCNGHVDCRDGSDEGPFCETHKKMCKNVNCTHVDSKCIATREGPTCGCDALMVYNNITRSCEHMDVCDIGVPLCPQICKPDKEKGYKCLCEEGYLSDWLRVVHGCFAPSPEARLIFTTKHEVKALWLKREETVTLVSDLHHAHGVAYTGDEVFWVETAEGHESINKMSLKDTKQTKEVVVAIGLEDIGNLAYDHYGRNIYFTDAERGVVAACQTSGFYCTVLVKRHEARTPKFLTLHTRQGMMYWADYHDGPVIMSALMDGSNVTIITDKLQTFASGLALDAPSGRLYFVDTAVRGLKLDSGKIFGLFGGKMDNPYAFAVFENTLYWSDWYTNTINAYDKMFRQPVPKFTPYHANTSVFSMQIYHPILFNTSLNPCLHHKCSHLCLITSSNTHVCGCPEGMQLHDDHTCEHIQGYSPRYIAMALGTGISYVPFETLGSPMLNATMIAPRFRAAALAYDHTRGIVYIFDAIQKKIFHIKQGNGVHKGIYSDVPNTGFVDVVDMDYDYASDCLYILDAGRLAVEVVCFQKEQRQIAFRFENFVPISMCIITNYGLLIVAGRERGRNNAVHIVSMGLDGSKRKTIVDDLKGPMVSVRYSARFDSIFFSDSGRNIIEFMHHEGTARQVFKELSTSILDMTVADNLIFWTDRRSNRLYWSDIQENSPTVRRIALDTMWEKFDPQPGSRNLTHATRLHLQYLPRPPDRNHPMMYHKCRDRGCKDICIQTPHSLFNLSSFTCLCPMGHVMFFGGCLHPADCKLGETYCRDSDVCVPGETVFCDGNKDCPHGEDEELCDDSDGCSVFEVPCLRKNGTVQCIHKNEFCDHVDVPGHPNTCSNTEHMCNQTKACVPRSYLCDGQKDCPEDGSDEDPKLCFEFECLPTEFRCAKGSCILKQFVCDGETDCVDGSDEDDCGGKKCDSNMYQCDNGKCVAFNKRCDGNNDCLDNSDERFCDFGDLVDTKEEPENCPSWERPCELNKSICVPITAWCNVKFDCPGGTDEVDCPPLDCRDKFDCAGRHCIPHEQVCDGYRNCFNGADETPAACSAVNKTATLFPVVVYPKMPCPNGYRCKNGQCIHKNLACNGQPDCEDGSDEGPGCATATEACRTKTACDHCQPLPTGTECTCADGMDLVKMHEEQFSCVDRDECLEDVCSQICQNVPRSYICSCEPGYALRPDRHSCKAITGVMTVYFISGHSVKVMSVYGREAILYHGSNITGIIDIDIDMVRDKLYLSSAQGDKLIVIGKPETNSLDAAEALMASSLKLMADDTAGDNFEVDNLWESLEVTNVGQPTRVAVDWITGNVYFVDETPNAKCIRVCNMMRMQCARLQKLAENVAVTDLAIDPFTGLMFYCLAGALESMVMQSTLAGLSITDVTSLHRCSALVLDLHNHDVYITQPSPAAIFRTTYSGDDMRCLRYGEKNCEVYLQQPFHTKNYVLSHPNIQREDVRDSCADIECDSVCVLQPSGPTCVCSDGAIAEDGVCPPISLDEAPLFNGTPRRVRGSSMAVSILVTVLLLILLAIAVLGAYYYHQKMKQRGEPFGPVHFRAARPAHSSTYAETTEEIPTPSIEMPPTPARRRQFSNPFFGYLRNSFARRRRPFASRTAGIVSPTTTVSLMVDESQRNESAESLGSDTESSGDSNPLETLNVFDEVERPRAPLASPEKGL